ncbi:hypothetical protein HDU98_011889 [Podochytrium sp. JEL0797]|nr:hypothetical protein HDU98_011889 [Podochytrium sp. JEL0797]
MIFTKLAFLSLAATSIQVTALPLDSSTDIVSGSTCATFGEWICDSTNNDLLQCAYGDQSNSLTWISSGAACPTFDVGTAPAAASSATILNTGSGDGTYYYDINNQHCPGQNSLAATNNFPTSCEPGAGFQTLASHGNNYMVALDITKMTGNKATYCGKRVIVSYKGQVMPGNFVVWDSCLACAGGGRLDFSLGALQQIEPNACQLGVVSGMSWEVTNEQVIPYVA